MSEQQTPELISSSQVPFFNLNFLPDEETLLGLTFSSNLAGFSDGIFRYNSFKIGLLFLTIEFIKLTKDDRN